MTFQDLNDISVDLWTYLQNTEKPIVMYGTGNGADKIINVFIQKNIHLYGIFASDDFARGQTFRGYTVKKYADFVSELEDFTVVVSFASQREEVISNILRIAEERELYAPDVPVFGDGLFDLEYFNKNKKRLHNIYNKLCDEVSKNTFACSVAFKLTGNISYLAKCETTEEETYALISDLIKCKNYVDIGAYTGDTVEKYTEYFGNDMNLYAFEPDEKNHKKMLERFNLRNISCKTFQAAAWNKDDILRFNSRSGRASSAVKDIFNEKFKDIPAVRVDSVIHDEIGFVKIDAEGSDKEVLEGLSGIIQNCKPCLKVAAYHRNEDFFLLPETVSEIEANFKLYMRHLRYIPGWDTDFIFKFED